VAKPSLPYPVVRLIPKRGENDCAVATLASYLRRDYEEVLVAAAKVRPTVWAAGMYCTDVARVAARLGVRGRWLKSFDVDNDSGVLWVSYNDNGLEHMVLLDEGKIFELDHNPVTMWDTEQFFGHYNAVPKQLFVRYNDD
jgi:hypothetical protein